MQNLKRGKWKQFGYIIPAIVLWLMIFRPIWFDQQIQEYIRNGYQESVETIGRK